MYSCLTPLVGTHEGMIRLMNLHASGCKTLLAGFGRSFQCCLPWNIVSKFLGIRMLTLLTTPGLHGRLVTHSAIHWAAGFDCSCQSATAAVGTAVVALPLLIILLCLAFCLITQAGGPLEEPVFTGF